MVEIPLEQDIADGVNGFSQLITRLNEKRFQFSEDNSDHRDAFWDLLFTVTNCGYLELRCFSDFVMDMNESIITKYFDPGTENMSELRKNYYRLMKSAFLTNFMFKIEYFLQGIKNQLSIQCKDGYTDMVEVIIHKLSLENSKEKIKLLKFLAEIRNSLHNNGLYNKNRAKLEVIIGNQTYTLVPGQVHSYGFWSHLHLFIDESLNVLEEIENHPDIKKHPHIISID